MIDVDADPLRWGLERIVAVTTIPADKRGDLDYLRSAVMLAHSYAAAALQPPLDPPEEDAEPSRDTPAPD